MNNDLIWSKFLENVKIQVNAMVFDTWFKPLKLYKLDDKITGRSKEA